MSKRIVKQYTDLLSTHHAALAAATQRGEASDAAAPRGETLGTSARRLFLAHTGLATLDEAITQAKVLAHTKRSALLQIGDLFAIAGKFGVIQYGLPMSHSIGSFAHENHSVWGVDKPILDRIGAFADGRDGSDIVYNYSKCAILADAC